MNLQTAQFLQSMLSAGAGVGAISALLGALISVTDRIVNNYGEVKVRINGGKKEIPVKGGSPLLLTLAEQGIFVPSACGGRGSCGACKVKVTSDVGPVLPTELPYLTKEELAANIRLSCQIKVKGDIDIEIPESLFNIRKVRGTVEKITDLTHDIKEVLVQLPAGEGVNYVAGQYGQVEVPAYGKIKEATQRAYSMSSNPADPTHLEFLIRLVPGGIVTTYVHEQLKEGQQLNIVAPVGDFAVRDTTAPMICVAGGSGMAPFKSVFQSMINSGEIERRDVWYFFGARSKRDLFYLDWLYELDATYEHFHFVPALSEPQPEDDWKGDSGLITEVLASYLRDRIPPEPDGVAPKEGYLCGSPGMLNACINVMHQFDMPDDRIFFDKFA